MLPILRILPVGGVLIAVLLLALAFSARDGSRAHLVPNGATARGALLVRGEHPEWRQFLIIAAMQRADELNRLRELPDVPTRTDPELPAPKVAGRSSDHGTESSGESGSTVQQPVATIPLNTGEPAPAAPEEKPPVIKPTQLKSDNDGRIKSVRHKRRARTVAKPVSPVRSTTSEWTWTFGNLNATPPTTANNTNAVRAQRLSRRPLKKHPAPL
jgi:hypothetical protein